MSKPDQTSNKGRSHPWLRNPCAGRGAGRAWGLGSLAALAFKLRAGVPVAHVSVEVGSSERWDLIGIAASAIAVTFQARADQLKEQDREAEKGDEGHLGGFASGAARLALLFRQQAHSSTFHAVDLHLLKLVGPLVNGLPRLEVHRIRQFADASEQINGFLLGHDRYVTTVTLQCQPHLLYFLQSSVT